MGPTKNFSFRKHVLLERKICAGILLMREKTKEREKKPNRNIVTEREGGKREKLGEDDRKEELPLRSS